MGEEGRRKEGEVERRKGGGRRRGKRRKKGHCTVQLTCNKCIPIQPREVRYRLTLVTIDYTLHYVEETCTEEQSALQCTYLQDIFVAGEPLPLWLIQVSQCVTQ